MSVSQEALGYRHNVIAAASGVDIYLTNAQTVTFYSFLDAGTQTLTLTEAINGGSDVALAIIDHVYKAPGVGGVWTEVTQTAANTFDLTTDATNDCFAVTVRAKQLTDGYNTVKATVDSGICFAVITDLDEIAHPDKLPSPIAA